jgi:hypothetical protein
VGAIGLKHAWDGAQMMKMGREKGSFIEIQCTRDEEGT